MGNEAVPRNVDARGVATVTLNRPEVNNAYDAALIQGLHDAMDALDSGVRVLVLQGGCFGGGTGIVAACDVVIAADDATFSIAETRWGLTAAIILPQLGDAIGVRQVRRYALTGERFGAEEARRIGLVHEVVPAAELSAAGHRAVDQLLQNAPQANAQTKGAALQFAWGAVEEGVLEGLVAQHAAKRRSAEAAEGLASLAEKRAARWPVAG